MVDLLLYFMKKSLIVSIFFLICLDSIAQREIIKTYYKNGRLESKGFLYTYSIYSNIKSLPKKLRFFGELEKKGKMWKYWYQTGELKRIENYKLIKDKNPYDLPDGNWTYFNEQGIKYREDTYKDGVIINSIKEIYKDSRLAGKITFQNGISDTTLLIPLTIGQNLIINPEFDFFFYKPVPVIYDGRSRIEEWIPFWITPGNYTPDYLSNLRSIDVLSNYSLFDFLLPDKFCYAGFALYKESEPYSEYIQGKLIKPLIRGQKYCIKVSIALPSYSGYYVNHLGFHLSSGLISTNESNESSFIPQVMLSTLAVDNKRFITLCDDFIAAGGEQFITIGRFTSPDKLEIFRRENIPQSQFGIDKSAYYFLDNIYLYEIHDTLECFCESSIIPHDPIKTVQYKYLITETDLKKLRQGNSIILKNVNFDFDSYRLLPDADTVLKTLYSYLRDNPDIRITISGHTDDTGTEDYNHVLSVNRAKSVRNWLINNGIDSTRLQFAGFGKSIPLVKENDEKSRALNRRVEVKRSDLPEN